MQETPLKVLLVEDNPTDALLVEIAFEEMAGGADLKHVTRASEAIEQLKRHAFDIVLLDLGLPDSNGLETFSTLHRTAPGVPIIALTGLSDEKLALEALQQGASDYLIKGQTAGALLERATRYAIERKRNENNRIELVREQAARQEAEANNRAKDEFLATLSHELRTPLNAIMGWASLIRTGNLSPEMTSQAVETIERNAQAQARLIEDLLDVSRIITGNLRLNVAPTEMRQLIERVVEGLKPALSDKTLDLQLDLQPVPMLYADTMRLQQVVWNLLSNAIKFTPEGGRIEVVLDKCHDNAPDKNSPDKTWVQLSIRDSGQGIAPEFLPHVFDRFRQADGSTTRRHGGLGLGLAIVRNLVLSHDGTVEVESDGIGQGALFRVRLPMPPTAAQLSEDSCPPPSIDSTASIGDAPPLHGLKVLAIDDQDDARRLLETVLSTQGAEVKMADSAAAALAMLKSFCPHIIVSDVGMPEMDGYALMRHIRALPGHEGGTTPAIALTGYARNEERDRAMQAGFQAFLSKPVQAIDLISAIARLSGRS